MNLRAISQAARAQAASSAKAASARRPALRNATAFVTPLGWTVAGIGAVAWLAGWRLGWRELLIVAATCMLLLVGAALFVLRRPSLLVDVVLEPCRVVAGEPSAGQLSIRNGSSRRSLPARVELPVGAGTAAFEVGSMEGGATQEEVFVVPTERRGVIPVGPATSVRSDPVGLLTRVGASGGAYELIVHPRSVPLEPIGSGLLRDLEGLTTKDLSMSDLAFHALREYAPGDDRRYIHWKSSAKAGRLLVRQFQDTRRSALAVLVDAGRAAYGEDEDFEVASSVAASLARRACLDGLTTTIVSGDRVATAALPHLLLDTLSRAGLGEAALDSSVARAAASADLTYAVLVSGAHTTADDLRRLAGRFAPETRVLGVRVAPGERPAVLAGTRATVVQLGAASDLPGLLRTRAAA